MPRDGRVTRQQILARSYELFYRKGYNRVGVDEIAAAAQVTKRTLYNHFKSKDVLLASVLEFQSELAWDRIQQLARDAHRNPESLVDSLFSSLAAWATRPRWSGAGFTRVALELADMPGHSAHAIARRHKIMVEDWFAQQLCGLKVPSARERACEVMLLMEGAMVLMLIHRDSRFASAASHAAKRLLNAVR